MNSTKTALAICTLSLALVACKQETAQTPAATQAPDITVGQSPETPSESSQVSGTELAMYVSDPRVQNWQGIGSRDANRLVSNGTNGYLMFGPKVPFEAGKYHVTVFGDELSIAPGNKIIFDATGSAGQQVFGKTELDENSKLGEGGELASWDIDLAAPVADLEVRAFVTSGSTIAITRYEVKPATAGAN